MILRIAVRYLLCLLWVVCPFADGNAEGVDLELLSVEKIWDAAPHNAFTDLIHFNGKFICGFREASGHAGGVKGSQIRLIASQDAKSWESVATLKDARGDIRDAKFAVLPDGRFMLLTALQLFDESQQKHQSVSWLSRDFDSWEGPHDVGEPDIWTWGIGFHNGRGYSIGYRTVDPRFVRLYATTDGVEFSTLVPDLGVKNKYPNESVIVFDDVSGTAFCLLRCSGPAQFGIASPPYDNWTWTILDAAVGGPEMIRLADGSFLGGGRLYDGGARTSLFSIQEDSGTLKELLKLPSGGDTSYPGFVLIGDTLYVSYYSSHEGKSSIYLAVVKVSRKESLE